VDVINKAAKEKVILSSPTTLVAILNMYVTDRKVGERIKNIDKTLNALGDIYEQYQKWNVA
jgi:DNA anti-recombination protein RmuC